jgi:hypothetical protein
MKYEEESKMLTIEKMGEYDLQIACVKKQGWKILVGSAQYECNGEFVQEPIHLFSKDKTVCLASDLPDYKNDYNVCLSLMKLVWGKEPDAILGWDKLNKKYYVKCYHFTVTGETIQIVIMKAFLTME